MRESIVAHITKQGYDLIAKKLSGQINRLEITGVVFGGATSPAGLTPYVPSIFDEAIPNPVFTVDKDNIDIVFDASDGLLTLIVRVSPDLAGRYFLNAIGVIANNNVLFASNSISITKVDTGNELVFAIKIPFLPDTVIDSINLKPPAPENPIWTITSYQDVKTNAVIPAGYEGRFYSLVLNKPSIYAYVKIKVISLTPLHIDYISISHSALSETVLFSDIVLDTSTFPEMAFKIPQPFTSLHIANKRSADDVIYTINVEGVKFK